MPTNINISYKLIIKHKSNLTDHTHRFVLNVYITYQHAYLKMFKICVFLSFLLVHAVIECSNTKLLIRILVLKHVTYYIVGIYYIQYRKYVFFCLNLKLSVKYETNQITNMMRRAINDLLLHD